MIRQVFRNIASVAHYEAKLLGRSWFFRIFALFLLAFATLFIFGSSNDNNDFFYVTDFFPSLFACLICIVLNITQSIVVIFLSSDYLKRDKQLDTSEVFYVHPLSNAEYLLGKMWGTFYKFIFLDVVLLSICFVLGRFVLGIDVSPLDFLTYFLIIILPTIVFFIGTSTMVMLLIGNQSIAFVVMLGIAAVSFFYVGNLYNNIFDIFGSSLPIYRSEIIGYTNLDTLLSHRLLYLLLGISSVLLCIFLFHRLAGTNRSKYKWLVLSICLYGFSVYCGDNYIRKATEVERNRDDIIALNNEHINTAKIYVDDYDIEVEHLGKEIVSVVEVKGLLSKDAESVVFSMNSALKIEEVQLLSKESKPLSYQRKKHLIVVDLAESYSAGDSVALRFKYRGNIDRSEMFIDVKGKVSDMINGVLEGLVIIDKVGSLITNDWVVLTPESYWYPRAGISYTDSILNWNTEYFSNYRLKIKPLPGMIPVTQGQSVLCEDSLSYSFSSDTPYRAVSLAISNYKVNSLTVDSTNYSIYIHPNNAKQLKYFDQLKDTLPGLIRDMKANIERDSYFDYSLDRFTIVDVPEQIFSYPRLWSTTQELLQPELAFIPGAGFKMKCLNYEKEYERRKRAIRRGWKKHQSDLILKIEVFQNAIHQLFRNKNNENTDYKLNNQYEVTASANPYYINSAIFNSTYNIYSEEYPWGTRMIEDYLLTPNGAWGNSWRRKANGLSLSEQALLLLSENGIGHYFSDPNYSSLTTELTGVMGTLLFAEAQHKLGYEGFSDSLLSLIEGRPYDNITFQEIIGDLEKKTETDINSKLELSNQKIELSAFNVESVTKTKFKSKDGAIYVFDYKVRNLSNVGGYIEFRLWANRHTERFVVYLGPGEYKRIVKHFTEDYQYPSANTLNSYNLPQIVTLKMIKGRSKKVIPPEGEYVLQLNSLNNPDEIIVDNEDEELFSVSSAPMAGYLNTWIDKRTEGDFKYKGSSGRAPYRWTPVTGDAYYGDAIQSGYRIRSGDGEQSVEWKIPVPEPGRYSFYTSATSNNNIQKLKKNKRTPIYEFTIDYGKGDEVVEVALSELNKYQTTPTWVWINDFVVTADTAKVSLSNKSNLKEVTADAIRVVRLDRSKKNNKQ